MTENKGGSSWELSEAIKLMGEAVASGDPEQIATAMRRHAEALTNSANTTLIPTLRSVLESVVKQEVGELSTRLDNSDRARLARSSEFQSHIDTKFDRMWDAVDGLKKETQDGIAALGGQFREMADDVGQLKSDMRESQEDRQNIHSEVAGVKGDVADVRSDVAALQRQFASYIQGSKRDDVEEIRTQLREMRGEYTQEQRERYTAIILDMIAAWEADHGQR